MFETAVAFVRYFVVLAFGACVAVTFAGVTRTRRNALAVGSFIVVIFILQLTSLKIWGMETTIRLYPLLTHVPMVLFVTLYLKRPLLIAVTSGFVSYLCCQLPRWIGTVAGSVFQSVTMNHLGFIVAAVVLYFFLRKYVAPSVTHMMERSVKSCLLFGAMPALNYFFDYGGTVYTNFLYSGTRAAAQLMPFLISAFYFLFVLMYYAETQNQARIQRERDMLESQFKQAQTELASLRQIQETAAAYRHDMRHHFALLQGLAAESRIEEIREYLRTAQSDIDTITPLRFCENETVNLILSAFAARARQSDIRLIVEARLPDTLPFSDTELCSLLSNALENAVNAVEGMADVSQRIIQMRLYSKNNKLCMDIRNRYQSVPEFRECLPVSRKQGHGFGTKSMAHVVEKHGGVYQFSVKDGWFIFQATA